MPGTYTNFCCRSGGSNANAGTRTGGTTVPGTAADLSYAGGGWVSGTNVFTPASGDPVADGVAVDDYCNVNGAWIARVASRTTTTITLSATGTGTKPGNGTYTLNVGGAWQGPTGGTVFPFNLSNVTNLRNASLNPVRINFKDDQTLSTTATQSNSTNDMTLQGFATSYGDGGRAAWNGPGSGTAFVLLSLSGVRCVIINMEFAYNGGSSTAALFSLTGTSSVVHGCVFHDSRGSGVTSTPSAAMFSECEAYACNASNTAGNGAFHTAGGAYYNCIAHDNTGSNTSGFLNSSTSAVMACVGCISESNGGAGWTVSGDAGISLINCDAYNNGSHGITLASSRTFSAINSNFVKNGGYGINFANGSSAIIANCGFGSGTQANTSGGINTSTTAAYEETGTVTYASDVTPWVDPDNGDFRINLAAAKGTGNGNYLQTAPSYAGTVGYPDVGAVQHADGGGSSGARLVGPSALVTPGAAL